MYAWFLWDISSIIVNFIAVFAFLLFFHHHPKAFVFSQINKVLAFLFFITIIYMTKGGNIFGFIGTLICSFLIGFLICTKNEYKVDILVFISKVLAFFLLLSMGFWVLYLAGVPLPSSTIEFRGHWENVFHNYYFFTITPRSVVGSTIPRFSSVFLEPGHLGMITPFLLFIYRFNFKKKEVLIFLTATLLSFSLAGYIITVISAVLVLLTNSKKRVLYLLTFVLLLASAYLVIKTWNSGDNVINKYIVMRLEYDKGSISGYNVHSDDLAQYYERFIQTDKALFGIGSTEYQQMNWAGGSSGYKRLIIMHGFVGAFLFYLFYWAFMLKHKSLITFMFLLVLVITSLQRAWLYWEAVLIIFITGLAYINSEAQWRKN